MFCVTTLLFILLLNSLNFLFCKTPLSMGMVLLIQTILISLNSGVLSHSFWFSYILFMIMLGGMLVLFIHITSLTSNLKFKFNKKIIFMNILYFTSGSAPARFARQPRSQLASRLTPYFFLDKKKVKWWVK